MTVAVANRFVMLADTKIVSGNVHYECAKIEELVYRGARFLVCGAGSGRDHDLFVRHFKRNGLRVTLEPLEEGFEALIVGPGGVYHVDSGGSPGLVRRGWFAIGSGGDVATGAIGQQIGLERREPTLTELRNAIHVATRYAECGGAVDEIWLDPKKARR